MTFGGGVSSRIGDCLRGRWRVTVFAPRTGLVRAVRCGYPRTVRPAFEGSAFREKTTTCARLADGTAFANTGGGHASENPPRSLDPQRRLRDGCAAGASQ